MVGEDRAPTRGSATARRDPTICERDAVKVLAILDDHPGASPRATALLRILVELVSRRPDVDVTLLLDGQALRLAVGELPPRTDRYCVTHLVESVRLTGGTVAASAVGLAVRGIPRSALRRGVVPMMPLQVEALAESSDRVWRF